MKTVVTFLLCVLAFITTLPCCTAAGSTNQSLPLQAVVELQDGSRLLGTLVQDSLPFHSESLGDFRLPISRLRSVEWPENGAALAHLKAANGDELQVRWTGSELRLKTSFGEAKLPAAVLRRLEMGPAVSLAELKRGLVALWSGEDNARDCTGRHSGRLLNGVEFAPGKVGKAFKFTTDQTRVSISDSKDFEFHGSFTVAGWVYVSEFPGEGHAGLVCTRGDNRFGLDTWTISTQPGQQLAFGLCSTDPNETTAVFAPVQPEHWVHAAGVYDQEGKRLALYLDGQLAAETNNPVEPIWKLDQAQGAGVGLGNPAGNGVGLDFIGMLDECVIYSRALSATEIQGLVELGNAGKRILPADTTPDPMSRLPRVPYPRFHFGSSETP